ncbi:S1 family peptidase [Laspinema olomoucense]|uniref:S1 family peptidase n=1 Tax=Laspinema olomoucense TaxID=3231600 RepID=UPI0021BBB56D|nr:serine protease [Laspinema sp. D3d]MCT7971213.1 serine protease [Laspinema sp. D3d]
MFDIETNIATDLVEFFYFKNTTQFENQQGQIFAKPKSIHDFFEVFPEHYDKHSLQITAICHQLVSLGLLVKVDSNKKIYSPFNEHFLAPKFSRKEADYGVYNFALTGFPGIYKRFNSAVRPVFVIKSNGDDDTGSGFLVKKRYFVTAKHCIEKMQKVTIPGWNPQNTPLQSIWVSPESNLDLAILEFKKKPFRGVTGFELHSPQILDEVLTMGYPYIPGFESFLIVETARIASLKSSVGQIVGQKESYLGKQNYFLISARVKGGNSGSPVIGRDGKVRGVVVHVLHNQGKLDELGYGVALPANHSFFRWLDRYDYLPADKMAEKQKGWSVHTEDKKSVSFTDLKCPLKFVQTSEGFSTL